MKEMIYRRFCALQAVFWSYQAVLAGYITSYMLARGMSSPRLGIAISCNLLTCFLGGIFWGQRIDREQANRKYFLLGLLANLVTGILVWAFAGTAILSIAFYAVFGFVNGFMATNLDSWVMISFPEKKEALGYSRSFATLSYAFVMFFFGMLIQHTGFYVMPAAASLLLAGCFFLAWFQPETPHVERAEEKRSVHEDIAQLAGNHRYCFLILVLFVTGLSVAPLDRMKPVVYQKVGGTVGIIGLDALVGCMIQYPFLLFSGKLKKIPQNIRMQAGIICPLIYMIIITMAKTPAVVMFGSAFTYMSFGILFSTYRELTENCVDHRLRNTAHSLVDAFYGSVSGMLALTYSGTIISKAGVSTMASISVCTQLTAVVITLIYFRTKGIKGFHRMHRFRKA